MTQTTPQPSAPTSAPTAPPAASLAEQAERSYARWGDRPALWFEGRWWSSGELRERARHWAGGLLELGVQPGDRVVVLLPNVPEVGVAYAAAWRVGAVVTPVVFLVGEHELAHVLADSGAAVVVTRRSSCPRCSPRAPPASRAREPRSGRSSSSERARPT